MTMEEMAPHKGQAFAYSRLWDGPGALPAAMCEIRSIVERLDPSGGEGVHPAAKNCKSCTWVLRIFMGPLNRAIGLQRPGYWKREVLLFCWHELNSNEPGSVT